jgi:outer membrane protein
MKSILTLALFSLLSLGSIAQKVGHINTNELVELMPEKAQAEQELTNMHIELESLLAELLEKYNDLYNNIVQNESNWSPIIRKMKQDELKRLEQTIQEAKVMAEEEMVKKELELVQPILDKAKEAISQVAAEEGYDYILDTSVGNVLVFPENKDILELVAKKLGISITP